MARIRTIKPEFWDSPGTARASLRARLFFIAMWNWADDWGIGDANPKRLVGFAFPNDDNISAADYPTLRQEVSECYDVQFYEAEGRQYYCIPSWEDHQRTEKKARRANPGPDEADSPVFTGVTDVPTDGSGLSDAGSRKRERGNRGTGEEGKNNVQGKPAPDFDSEFTQWWVMYPRKQAKAPALKAFKRIRKTVPLKTLMDGVQAYALLNIGLDKSLIKLPAGWLNDARWEDEQIVNATKHTTTEQPAQCQIHAGYPLPCDACRRDQLEGRAF